MKAEVVSENERDIYFTHTHTHTYNPHNETGQFVLMWCKKVGLKQIGVKGLNKLKGSAVNKP